MTQSAQEKIEEEFLLCLSDCLVEIMSKDTKEIKSGPATYIFRSLKSQGFHFSKWLDPEECKDGRRYFVKFKNRCGHDVTVKAFYANKFTVELDPYADVDADPDFWDHREGGDTYYWPEGWYEEVYSEVESVMMIEEEIEGCWPIPLPPVPQGDEK